MSLFEEMQKERERYKKTREEISNLNLNFKRYNLDGKCVYNPSEIDLKLKTILTELIDIKERLSGNFYCDGQMQTMIEAIKVFEKNLNIKLEN